MGDRLEVEPPLGRDDVVFLAGFGPEPVRSHDGRPVEARTGVVRAWPAQPALPSPWVPCAEGCCLLLAPGRGTGPAGQWLRFLVERFLAPAHRVSGTAAPVGLPGRPACLLVVEAGEVFEGYVS
jgi:hypothetical protein